MKSLLLLLLVPMLAFGTSVDTKVTQSNDMNNQTAGDVVTGGGEASSENNYVSNYDSNFFAFSTSFPNAVGCFGGAQGGVSGDSAGGFFGVHAINPACWLNQLSEAEKSLDIRARLKCGDKHFRSAITYNVSGNKLAKTQACIDFITPIWKAEIANELSAAEKYRAELECSYVGGVLTLTNECVLDD